MWMRDSHQAKEETEGFQYLDIRLTQISAKNWTAVPCDDETFAKLLAVYLVREEPTWGVLDIDLFLDELVRGKQKYCSQLLVNAILALAAVRSRTRQCC